MLKKDNMTFKEQLERQSFIGLIIILVFMIGSIIATSLVSLFLSVGLFKYISPTENLEEVITIILCIFVFCVCFKVIYSILTVCIGFIVYVVSAIKALNIIDDDKETKFR